MFVYILRSEKDGSIYVGSAKNVETRLKQHNTAKSLATKPKIPWKLIRLEEYEIVTLALKREKFLKTSRGREVVKNLCSL